MFGCGEAEYGQLGVGYVSVKEYRPARAKFRDLDPGDYVTKVACGAHHTAYLTRYKQVYATGANNLGQLGIDSLESQVNSPVRVEAMSDKSVRDITCGESSFAITEQGEMYVWGLYNLELYRKPFRPSGISRPLSAISQSFFGVTAAIDCDAQAWYWHTQLDVETQNLMKLTAYPVVIRQMRRRAIAKVFAGKDLVFALGDDVHTNASSSTVKDSQASSGLQEIPERDERPSSSTMKMPMLNLAKLHKGSTGSLKRSVSKEKSVHEESRGKSRSRTPSRSCSRSGKKAVIRRLGSTSAPRAQKQRAATKESPPPAKRPQVRPSSGVQQSRPKKRQTSQHHSERKPNRGVRSCSKSKNSSQPRTRSTSHQKLGRAKAPAKTQVATLVSAKSSKSVGGRPVKKRSNNLEKAVAQKF